VVNLQLSSIQNNLLHLTQLLATAEEKRKNHPGLQPALLEGRRGVAEFGILILPKV